MAGNKVYVQGSYIDVHDNENVYLSVDKAEVKVADEVKTTTKAVPEKLKSEEAAKYWRSLQEKDFVDADCQLLPDTTRKQAMYIAELFAERLGIKSKWKTFEQLWGISNLAQEKWDMQETGSTPPRSKDIDKIFEE